MQRSKGLGQGEPWWNKKCRDAVKEMRQAQRYQSLDAAAGIIKPHASDILTKLKSKVHRVVKNAKRDNYCEVLEKLDSKSIFQAVKWSSSIRQYTAPPIQQQDATLAVDNLSKQKALRKELLTPPATTTPSRNIQVDLSQQTRDDVVLWYSCTMQEVEAGIMHAENTASGLDEIPPAVI